VSAFRIVPAGDSALIVEFEERIDPAVNARAIGCAEAIQGARITGVRDVVPTFRSVAVYFDPLRTDSDVLQRCLEEGAGQPLSSASAARTPVRIPVCYGGDLGPDLADVASFAGMPEADVVRVHAGATYRVFMLGFVPGFAYLGIVDTRIAMPRHATPRVRVPVGSVGIAGVQTGVYPAETPGGWQLIGRTPIKPFDPSRADPFLMQAGDAVQFYPIDRAEYDGWLDREFHDRVVQAFRPAVTGGSEGPHYTHPAISVIKPGMLTTIQDAGRWGFQSRGVPVAGPMDPVSHRLANALVGNGRDAALLEVTLLGPELEFEDERLVAVAGAEFELSLDGRQVPSYAPFTVAAGSRLRFGARRLGARAYLAVSGGITVAPTLGSRSTHLVSAMGGIGGRALMTGDRLPLGDPSRPQGMALAPQAAIVALPDHHATIRVLPGPQVDYFTPDALDVLRSAPYVVAQNSDRMGFRLEGPRLTHARGADIISDATPLGVLQVPASGQPILLMADRQTTGGYPKIATMIAADMTVAGQLAPADTITFVVCTPHDALRALIAQERALMALEDRRS
jgi:KipI family sensor histidine kinase inhibitor